MTRHLSDNVTGYAQVLADVHKPTTVEEVVALVRAARAARLPLYPISTGLNYGYGGRSPVTEGCALVDLSAMNRIRNASEISVRNPVAVIEPGVTQWQLYEFLEKNCPELTFNVSGSARDTSILGNALDRGIGHYGPRKDDVFGLEVVCGSGKVLRTGFRRLGEESPIATCHPHGLGPILDGLFFQGNYGIVTSACFRLLPRPKSQVAVSLALRDEKDLPQFIDELTQMTREGLLNSITRVGNRARSKATMMHGITRYLEEECRLSPERVMKEAERVFERVCPGEWTSTGSIAGTVGQTRAGLAEIRRRMKRFARVVAVTDDLLKAGYGVAHRLRFLPFARAQAAVISATRPLHLLSLGVPTDTAVDNLLWTARRPDLSAVELDQSACGLLFINPALPLDGPFVTRVLGEMTTVAAEYGHTLYTTISLEGAHSLVGIMNLTFNRRVAEERERAHRCATALLRYIRSQGLEVYRARVDMMEDIVAGDPDYWKTIRSLKHELDPDNIIAPGRYNLAT